MVATAERASRPRSAVGMPLQVALGDHTRPGSSAAAVAQPCRRSGTAAHNNCAPLGLGEGSRPTGVLVQRWVQLVLRGPGRSPGRFFKPF